MNRSEIIDRIHNDLQCTGTPISKTQVDAVLRQLGDLAQQQLTADHEFRLPRIGTLYPRGIAHGNGKTVALACDPQLENAINR